MYRSITVAHEDAAKAAIPVVKKTNKQLPWEHSNLARLRASVKVTNSAYVEKSSREKIGPLDNALGTLEAAYDTNKQTYIENKIREIETAHITRKSKLIWATVNEVANRGKSSAARPSSDHPSEELSYGKNILKIFWVDLHLYQPTHTEDIDTIISETLPIHVHEFTMEELTSAIRSTSSGKAPGLDNIPAEVWKSGALLEYPLNVCDNVFNSGEASNIWRKAAIVPMPK